MTKKTNVVKWPREIGGIRVLRVLENQKRWACNSWTQESRKKPRQNEWRASFQRQAEAIKTNKWRRLQERIGSITKAKHS